MRRLIRFAKLPSPDRRLLMRAFAWVASIRLVLWTLPLRWIRPWLSDPGRHWRGDSVDKVVWAVTTASRYFPAATCLTQALAAQVMLTGSGYPFRVEIGVSKKEDVFAAHAWLVYDGRVVLGGPDVDCYTPLMAWEGKN